MNKKQILYFFCSLILLVGCRTAKHSTSSIPPETITSKFQLVVPKGNSTMKLSGVLKMQKNKCIRMVFLMPFLHSEIFRIEFTPEHLLFIDRMNKRYGSLTDKNIERIFSQKTTFKQLQKQVLKVYKKGEGELNAHDIGFKALRGAKIKFYRFKSSSQILPLTEISSQYKAISTEEIYYLIKSIS